MKQIPQIVKDAASYLIEMFGDNFDYLGKYEGADVYMYHFSEEVTVGARMSIYIKTVLLRN